MNNREIEGSLVETLKNSDLSEITTDTSELGLDEIIEDGLLQDIPVVSTLVKLVKTGVNIRDYFFAKNLFKFLASLSELSSEQRKAMVERLEDDEAYRNKVGESLMVLLDRIDDIGKPELVAKAFKAYSSDAIDAEQLQRINYAIERLLMVDIGKLEDFSKISRGHIYDLVVGQNFLNAGLAYVGTGYGAGGTHPNDICNLFVQHILKV
ncbi:hypothetical protein [Thiohalophilus sp.]|uniref:hypothetical protein n=1 Tax=Thiohalophilus sp. TaxID=3028392 RepID=UPI002ACEF5E6|nr:hypothetical protein [Thiohalophilus sp.]MDZ7660908.1 hypothetical protein [Thiohalophilus sp.]